MSNVDTIGNLLKHKARNDVHKKVIDCKKIFKGYKSKKSKKVLENPYFSMDPKNYTKEAKKKLIFNS
jgi:hypothetical protein